MSGRGVAATTAAFDESERHAEVQAEGKVEEGEADAESSRLGGRRWSWSCCC